MECNWADPTKLEYRPELVELVETIARQKASKARYDWNIDIEYEDLRQELFLYLFQNPNKVANGRFPATILHSEAADICFRKRLQESTSIIDTDELYAILTEWNRLPRYVREALYGPVFHKAGKGRYLQLIEYVHQHGGNYALMPPADKKAYRRAVVRLAEIIAGVMCGKPASLSELPQDLAGPEQELETLTSESVDDTFSAWRGHYVCDAGHHTTAALAVVPPQRIGSERGIYGRRYCACGEELSLAAA
ncbi:hypothetical protein [Micromonospora matsumotoense]|uniref:hypothetical protein n=1 Tax=Micromonospora matsumotoense TaxID=121616 RepID=UPI0033EFFA90